jgi:hypothetical protein
MFKIFKNINKSIVWILFMLLGFNQYSYANSICTKNGYSVLAINGIFTAEETARNNSFALKYKLGNSYNNEPLTVDYLYNPTHNKVIDLLDAINQKLFEQNSYHIEDSDFIEMLTDASAKINTQKLLLVGHSQGNFYANTFYNKVVDEKGGIPSESLAVYSVATPTSYVSGGGLYVTSDTDEVIAGAVAKAPMTNILKPNLHIDFKKDNPEANGHGFANIYLAYEGSRIISDIKTSLDKLQNNDIQKEDAPCIDTPEFTIAQKVQSVLLAGIDGTVNGFNKSLQVGGRMYLAFINKTGSLLASAGSLVADGLGNATAILFEGFDSKNENSQDENSQDPVVETPIVPVKKFFNEDAPPLVLHFEDEQDILAENQNVNITTETPIIENKIDLSIENKVDVVQITPKKLTYGGYHPKVVNTEEILPPVPPEENPPNTEETPPSDIPNPEVLPPVVEENPPAETPPPVEPPPANPPSTSFEYTYIPKYKFGTDNGDGNNWQVWIFNGSNVYDWVDSYVGGYLRQTFKIQRYDAHSLYCSNCLSLGVFDTDPELGFNRSNIVFNHADIGDRNVQGFVNGIYDIDMQWDATGYNYSISHEGIIDWEGHKDIADMDNKWVGWNGVANDFKTFPSGVWEGVPPAVPNGLTGGSNMVLQSYKVHLD